MSQMLDALKKLEAKSSSTPAPRAGGGGNSAADLLATLALPAMPPKPSAPPTTTATAPVAPAPAKVPPRPAPPAPTRPAAGPQAPPAPQPPVSSAPPTSSPPPAVEKPVASDLPAPREQPTRLEEQVRAAVADPARAVPLEQLVRRLRSELRADRGRCWLFAGAGQHHDTSDLVAHLGPLFAGQLGDTLLVDATGEHASLSLGLDAAGRPGLSEIALHNASWPSLLVPTAWPHLFLLPAGKQMASVPDGNDPWATLLAQAERRFRLVLIDGGPASAPLCGALSRLCDATFLVLRLGLTETSEARQAIAQFRNRGARVLGTIATSGPQLAP